MLPEASVDMWKVGEEKLLLSMVRPLPSVNVNDVTVELMSVYGKLTSALPVNVVVNVTDRAYRVAVQSSLNAVAELVQLLL
jgi:hypothetical protein